jgi:hypothetical protein
MLRVATLTSFSATGLILTLFLIGAGLSQHQLKAISWKPMIQGVILL